jgi:hypothetical protein
MLFAAPRTKAAANRDEGIGDDCSHYQSVQQTNFLRTLCEFSAPAKQKTSDRQIRCHCAVIRSSDRPPAGRLFAAWHRWDETLWRSRCRREPTLRGVIAAIPSTAQVIHEDDTCALVTLACLPGLALAEFEPKTGWNHRLFPAYLIATAAIRLPAEAIEDDENEQVLATRKACLASRLAAPEDNTVVTVTVSCDATMQPSADTVTLEESGETYAIRLKIKCLYDKLATASKPIEKGELLRLVAESVASV